MESTVGRPSSTGSEESPAQRQARLRRERREAKIKADGSSRLEKITQVSGRPAEPAQPLQQSLSNSEEHNRDSNAASTTPSPLLPNNHHTAPPEADVRALLRAGGPPRGNDTERSRQGQPEIEDPMMRMLQQMMRGLAGEGQEGNDEGLPPGLASMLGGGASGGQGSQAAAPTSAYIWRILHAISALVLGVYLTTHSTFSSTSRLINTRFAAPPPASATTGYVEPEYQPQNMFWIFAATELVLQGSRYFLEEMQSQDHVGWLGMLESVLPEPWRRWLKLGMRYSGIWNTLVEDSMVVVFVLGVVGWWKGFGG